jgi:2-polyprenyl-3-methyl-5-hydroxy-6-metoxy-1,4-benzoquinol methylase
MDDADAAVFRSKLVGQFSGAIGAVVVKEYHLTVQPLLIEHSKDAAQYVLDGLFLVKGRYDDRQLGHANRSRQSNKRLSQALLVVDRYLGVSGDYYERAHTTGPPAQRWFYQTREAELLRFAKLQEGQQVMDLGCGSGVLTRTIARLYPGCKLVGVDISEAAVRWANAAASREGLKNARFMVGDASDLRIKERFDTVIVSHMLEHLKRPVEALRRLKGMLRPGGKIIVATPNNRSLWPLAEAVFDRLMAEPGYSLHEQHIFEFNPASLRAALLEAGYNGVEIRSTYHISLPVALLSRRLASGLLDVEGRLSALPGGMIMYARARP